MWSLHSSYWANVSCSAQLCVCLWGFFCLFFNTINLWVTAWLLFDSYWIWCLTNKWGNWLKNKRRMTDFRMARLIIWAVLACCWISWPVHLKHIHLLHLHILWKWEIHSRGQMVDSLRNRPDQTTWRYCGEVLKGHSRRQKLKTWFRRWRLALKAFHTHFAPDDIYIYIWGKWLLDLGHCSVIHLKSLKALEW